MKALPQAAADELSRLLHDYRLRLGSLKWPIDVNVCCEILGVSIHYEEMIHEGHIELGDNTSRIVLQSNFINMPGVRRRQRFTIAHELGHFFVFMAGKRRKRALAAMSDLEIEACCSNLGAKLLMPDDLLLRYVDNEGKAKDSEWLNTLANAFDVSIDLAIRRVNELGWNIESDRCLILVRKKHEREFIRGVLSGPWILTYGRLPKLNEDYRAWLSSLEQRATSVVRDGPHCELRFADATLKLFADKSEIDLSLVEMWRDESTRALF